MARDFTISYLSPEEYDKLPYKNIKTSLGVTDMRKKKIYIKDTGDDEMKVLVKQHELMESKLKNSPDEPSNEDGVRYLSLKKIISNVGKALSGLIGIGGYKIPESPQPQVTPPAPTPSISEGFSATSLEERRKKRLAKLRTGILSTIKTSPRGITGTGANLVSSVATGTKTLGA